MHKTLDKRTFVCYNQIINKNMFTHKYSVLNKTFCNKTFKDWFPPFTIYDAAECFIYGTVTQLG